MTTMMMTKATYARPFLVGTIWGLLLGFMLSMLWWSDADAGERLPIVKDIRIEGYRWHTYVAENRRELERLLERMYCADPRAIIYVDRMSRLSREATVWCER